MFVFSFFARKRENFDRGKEVEERGTRGRVKGVEVLQKEEETALTIFFEANGGDG